MREKKGKPDKFQAILEKIKQSVGNWHSVCKGKAIDLLSISLNCAA